MYQIIRNIYNKTDLFSSLGCIILQSLACDPYFRMNIKFFQLPCYDLSIIPFTNTQKVAIFCLDFICLYLSKKELFDCSNLPKALVGFFSDSYVTFRKIRIAFTVYSLIAFYIELKFKIIFSH